MTRGTLERFKVRLDIDINDDSKDSLLTILLEDAEEYILTYTRRGKEQWLGAFNAVRFQVAAINYTRLGAEGVQSQREGDITTAYLGKEDYPDSVTKALNPYRRVKH